VGSFNRSTTTTIVFIFLQTSGDLTLSNVLPDCSSNTHRAVSSSNQVKLYASRTDILYLSTCRDGEQECFSSITRVKLVINQLSSHALDSAEMKALPGEPCSPSLRSSIQHAQWWMCSCGPAISSCQECLRSNPSSLRLGRTCRKLGA
jgi:hypothetical protein